MAKGRPACFSTLAYAHECMRVYMFSFLTCSINPSHMAFYKWFPPHDSYRNVDRDDIKRNKKETHTNTHTQRSRIRVAYGNTPEVFKFPMLPLLLGKSKYLRWWVRLKGLSLLCSLTHTPHTDTLISSSIMVIISGTATFTSNLGSTVNRKKGGQWSCCRVEGFNIVYFFVTIL